MFATKNKNKKKLKGKRLIQWFWNDNLAYLQLFPAIILTGQVGLWLCLLRHFIWGGATLGQPLPEHVSPEYRRNTRHFTDLVDEQLVCCLFWFC